MEKVAGYDKDSLLEMSDEKILEIPFIVQIEQPSRALELVDYRKFSRLQEDENGSLKSMTSVGVARLKRAIMINKFKFPFILFELPEGLFLADGHGRLNLFSICQPIGTDGKPIYKFPVLRYKKENKKAAAEELLSITSQFNQMSQEGLDWFIGTYGLSEEDIRNTAKFDGIYEFEPIGSFGLSDPGEEGEKQEEKKKIVFAFNLELFESVCELLKRYGKTKEEALIRLLEIAEEAQSN
jgi:hypothetical protein